MALEQHYSVKSIAEIWDCDVSTIRRAMYRGEFGEQYAKNGDGSKQYGVRIPESVVNAWMRSKRGEEAPDVDELSVTEVLA